MYGIRQLLLLLFLLSLANQTVVAQIQPWNNQRQVMLLGDSTSILDSLTVIPNSLHLFDPDHRVVDTSYYYFQNNQLIWINGMPFDSVEARFRVLPYRLDAPFSLIDTTKIEKNPKGILIGTYNPYAPQSGLNADQKLNYQGSFSRGISVGNRQDLVLNSSFNLQMGGEIGGGVSVTAAITDENLPIQPEGNTRQLRDFDRIFIRLEKDKMQLTAGDYELTSPSGYFLRYYKKLEGATFQNKQLFDKGQEWTQSASVAIARGQFRRQTIQAQEGNQGPYKLQGASGERFIIVLAGTENVFLDGQALQRGRDADYIIDYNQGEVTFMARRLITKDSRIVIEFEYADQRYLRSLYAANTHYKNDRWQAYASLYSQQDSKNSTGDLDLSNEEKRTLSESGDQLNNSFISTIDTLDSPDSQRATYVFVDTVLVCNGQNIQQQFLRFSSEGLLVARFAFVGNGNGNYELDLNKTANERVYKWIAPDSSTCTPQGSYSPVRQLAAPELQRLLTAGGQYQMGKNGAIKAELAYSQKDLNRFSTLDSEDDNGLAAYAEWANKWSLGIDSSSWTIQTQANYEFREASFREISPYRSPEFLRDWNLANINGVAAITIPSREQLSSASFIISKSKLGQLKYRLSSFDRQDIYQGIRHNGSLQLERKGWKIVAQNSWLNSKSTTQNTRLLRPLYRIEKQFEQLGGWAILLESKSERSERQTSLDTDFLANSFLYQKYEAQLKSPQKEKWQFQSAYRSRVDYQPIVQTFKQSSRSREGDIQGNWQPNKQFRTSATLTYRQLEVIDSALTALEPAKTLLGRVDMTANLWNGTLRSNTSYEIGSGQEARIEFIYLFVGAGQGQYIWLDSLYNNDGKIQPNEMEIAPFPDIADHVRVSIFTDDFIRTDNVTLNQSISIDPSRVWKKSTLKWKQLTSRFTIQSSLSVNRKVRAFEGVQSWNPFQNALPDSALVALSSNQKHTLFFNRRSTKFDLRLERIIQPRRQVSTTGYESRLIQNTTLAGRLRLSDATVFRMDMTTSLRTADSEFFNNKDYELSGYSLWPRLQFQPGQDYRLELEYKWIQEKNQLPETGEELIKQEFRLTGNYQRWLRASVSYIDIEMMGDPRSPIGFVLLNGLQNGRNWVWNGSLTRQLGEFLQMTLTYEGRQTGESDIVHVGRVQVTAIF